MKRMPKQKPGESNQVVGTPWDFIYAVERRFGPRHVDLAALEENAKAPMYITPEMNSLVYPWEHLFTTGATNFWLNPEFAKIFPWAKKCKDFSSKREFVKRKSNLCLLTPASVGSNWFSECIHGSALVLALQPRITFVGSTTPYPKDCILSVFGVEPGFDVWRWNE